MFDLTSLGWDDPRAEEFRSHARVGLTPGRVSVQHRGVWDVLTAGGALRCDLAGRLYDTHRPEDHPAVGDWVAVAARPDERAGTIQAVLPRRTEFSRKAAGRVTEAQVVAANVDVVFIVSSLNEDLNLRRLERYLTLAWESAAQPVLVLTKSDLCHDIPSAVAEVESIAFGVPVHTVSTVTGDGIDELRRHLAPGVTGALLGSSGVGKSTLVNALVGREILATGDIREDDGRGRHTTTRRQLVPLPGGGLVIDTPGMRELQLWGVDQGLDDAFADVTDLFGRCRFSDCAHRTEPDCAVRLALDAGELSSDRWEAYLKLQRELGHLERRVDKRAAAVERQRWRTITRDAREIGRAKRRG